jgi:predicted MFS family arabinose efflux permease
VPGFVLSAAAASSLVYSLIEAPERGWGNPVILGGFGVALVLGALFAYRELRTPHPLVDLAFFRRPRFSAGVSAISLASFALFGTVFSFTLFLQFVQQYTPLQTGVRLIPLSIGIMVGAGGADRLAKKFGTNRVIASALGVLGVLLASYLLWDPDVSYWVVGVTLFVGAYALGSVIAPATDAVMGAVPQARAGIATAMNTVSRMVAGALGAAVTGSLLFTIYGSKVATATETLPVDMAAAAQDSIGAAIHIAATLPPEQAEALSRAAGSAFVDAMGLASLVGCTIALLGSLVIARIMPPQHLPDDQEPMSSADGLDEAIADV